MHISSSFKIAVAVALAATLAFPLPATAQDPVPRVVFNPALGVAQDFRVSYRLATVPADPAGARQNELSVSHRFTVTPITREGDGYRLHLLVSEVERPAAQGGMDMVVAAALMLDGFPIDMDVDARGFLKGMPNWPEAQRAFAQRAGALPGPAGSIARSVFDGHDAHQAAWHLARAIDAMGRARSYFDFVKLTGASTISWFGSPIDVTVEPDAAGVAAITWASPAGAGVKRTGEGRAVLRKDGFAAPLTIKSTRSGMGGLVQEILTIEPIAAR